VRRTKEAEAQSPLSAPRNHPAENGESSSPYPAEWSSLAGCDERGSLLQAPIPKCVGKGKVKASLLGRRNERQMETRPPPRVWEQSRSGRGDPALSSSSSSSLILTKLHLTASSSSSSFGSSHTVSSSDLFRTSAAAFRLLHRQLSARKPSTIPKVQLATRLAFPRLLAYR